MQPVTTTTKRFNFSREFQVGILALMMQKYDFLVSAVDLVQPDYFEDQSLIWYFTTIRDYFLDYHKTPTDVVLEEELRQSVQSGVVKQTEQAVYAAVVPQLCLPVNEADYLIKKVVAFCRRQSIRKTFLDYATKIDDEDEALWEKIQTDVTDACNVGAHSLEIGEQYFQDMEQRLHNRRHGEDKLVVPTGITDLDYQIGGGLKAGQLGIWMAGTGRGKSIALPQCGKRAVSERLKVAHYTLELDEEDIALRYDASYGNVPIQDAVGQESQIFKRVGKVRAMFGNSLIIKFYPTRSVTINAIKTHMRQLDSLGFMPDMLIVDYVDLLKPTTSYNDEYSDLGAITADLRGLAGEYKIPIWTATQVNRAGMASETIDIEHIGDSLRKAQIADVVIAICMTKEEREDKRARLYLAKNRNGPTGVTVEIETDYERMIFAKKIKNPPPIVGGRTGRRGKRVQT